MRNRKTKKQQQDEAMKMVVLQGIQLGVALGALSKTDECLQSWDAFLRRGGSVSRYMIAKLRKCVRARMQLLDNELIPEIGLFPPDFQSSPSDTKH